MRLVVTSISVVLASMLIVGCGGGSSASTGTDTSTVAEADALTGVVAIGIGVQADMLLIGSLGETIEAATDAGGVYSIDVSALTQPIMVQAQIRSNGNLMYSFAEAASGTVNVTPLTTFIVDQAAEASGLGGGASQLFQNFTENAVAAQAELAGATDILDAQIAAVMEDNTVGGFDHITSDFEANHEGYDAVLDALDIEMYQDDVIIRIDETTTLDTLNYDAQAATIILQGSMVNAFDMTPINAVAISMVDSAGNILSAVSDSNGSFSVTVDTLRTYDVTFTADGYEEMFFPQVPSFVFTDLGMGEIPMMPVSDIAYTTTVSGLVFDGRTAGTAVAEATMNFRAGYNARIGDIAATLSTDTSGNYTATDLPSGPYTVEIIKEGFETTYLEVVAYGTTLTQNLAMFADAQSSSAMATIVLNWGANPTDLDSHLTGGLDGATDRFHAYFGNSMITDSATYVDPTTTYVEPDYSIIEPMTDPVSGYIIDYSTGMAVFTDPNTGLYGDPMFITDPVSGLIFHWEYMDTNTGLVLDPIDIDPAILARFTLFTETIVAMDPALIDPYYVNPITISAEDPCAVPGALASLDRDETNGFGPETMSICQVEPGGMYKYYVHHFSGTSTMAESPATVTVTTASGASREFTAPVAGSIGTDDIWHVFNMDADGNIYPVNAIIGNDIAGPASTLFQAPALNVDTRFSADTGLLDNLPSK